MPYPSKKAWRRGRKTKRKLKRTRHVASRMPKTMLMKHRYTETIGLDAAGGGVSPYVFIANTLYDPNVTGTGHQPLMSDEMAAIYGSYIILGSKITAKFVNSSTGTTVSHIGIFLSRDSSISTSQELVLEQQNTKHTTLGLPGSTNGIKTITGNFSAKKFFSANPLTDDLQEALISADPQKKAYYILWQSSINSANNPDAIDVLVSIDYIALWKNRKEVLQS